MGWLLYLTTPDSASGGLYVLYLVLGLSPLGLHSLWPDRLSGLFDPMLGLAYLPGNAFTPL